MTSKNTIFDNFEALPQVIRYLMRGNAAIDDQVGFG
jgi:hypothetical protein